VASDTNDNTDKVNFSRVVWHESFQRILESIEGYSHVGCWKECGDKVLRFLFPFVFALSSDYEEQFVFYRLFFKLTNFFIRCVMALIRGVQGDCPCPICLVPRQKQSDYLTLWPQRTMDETRQLVEAAKELPKGQAEDLLKSQSIRPLEVQYSFLYYPVTKYITF
jgi:hypothetical protein